MDTRAEALPNEAIAATVVGAMLGENVLSSSRLATGDQHFVFAVKTDKTDYVLRMTTEKNRHYFLSAIYWQEKLIPLGVPLAKFIKSDLTGQYSKFASLLMLRLRGDDLCNVYSSLTNEDKRNIAREMVKIQSLTKTLPVGQGFGIISRYENIPEFKSWYDFLMQRLHLFQGIIKEAGIFDANQIANVISITEHLRDDLHSIAATPFLWDASERNVIIDEGKISGIVDVDEICFGDPLFVLGLTSTALANEGHDTLYTDYWAEALQLDAKAKYRLELYRLFYIVVFMRKHSMTTANSQKVTFDVQRLKNMFDQSLSRMNII